MTKRFLSILVSGLCLVYAGHVSHAQSYNTPPVSVSTEKVKMEGKQYYSHRVLEKQTIYSISKAYGVSPDDIYMANPGLRETGLKKDSVILIPDKSADKVQDSKRKKKMKDKEEYIIHTVRWYEDLDVISEKYGVPVDLIMSENGLKGRKLKNRQKLRIPVVPESEAGQHETAVADADGQETVPPSGTEQSEEPSRVDESPAAMYLFPSRTVSFSLLLPLNAKDSTAGSRSNMDFYSGALLAARDMGEKGINIDLSVYDTADGQLHVTEERLKKSDVVIGPVSYGDLGRLMASAPNSTYVVSPLDHRAEQLSASYKNFIQVPASYEKQYEDLVSWIDEERTPHDSVIVIYEKNSRDRSIIDNLEQRMESAGISYQPFSYSILEGRDILDPLRRKMALTARTHFLIASESEAFVNDVVRNINLMIHEKFDVALYALSKIRGFETIEVENLHNANLHVSTSYYIDYDRKEVQDFIMEYRALFNTEPTPFAFQGYDITRYFSEVCSKYGKAWSSILSMVEEEMLQSEFKFSRVKVGGSEIGYVNSGVRRIVYGPDYSVSLSKGL